ncbi:addiction module toxin RelE [Selenomonas sp. oral taxon 126]|jgi:hypothetical protein|nr:addiction module toxin RelE [Selenomonas sp. oral taxon 126]
MMYRVELSAQAKEDMREIYVELRAIDSAEALFRHLEEHIYALEEMPERYRLYEGEPWRTHGLRVMPVDHYLVFYIPNHESRIVTVIRILYGGRDSVAQLARYTENNDMV